MPSLAQRMIDKFNNGNEHEKEVFEAMTDIMSMNPTTTLENFHKMLWGLASLEDKDAIFEYIIMVDSFMDELGIENPNKKKKRLEEEAKHSKAYPPLKLVQ